MSSLERIVRPFQNNEVFTARVAPPQTATPSAPDEPVLVEIESRSTTDYIDEPPPASLGFQSDWVEDKSRRVTETVRVENPDDSEQFVNVERIKSTVLKNTTNGQEFPFKLNWT